MRMPVHINPCFGGSGVGGHLGLHPLIFIPLITRAVILFQFIEPLQHFFRHFIQLTGHLAFRLHQHRIAQARIRQLPLHPGRR
ncbi:hypothetical protein D3C81_1825570 [compost metagenome]